MFIKSPNSSIWSKILSTLTLLSLLCLNHVAQAYTNGPVKLVIPASDGGTTDILARLIAKPLSDAWQVPVIVEKHATATVKMDKNKFLVPKDSTIGSFVHVIRKRLHLSEKEAIFLMCQNTIPPTSEVMSIVYERHKDKEDNFLYFVLLQENTFG